MELLKKNAFSTIYDKVLTQMLCLQVSVQRQRTREPVCQDKQRTVHSSRVLVVAVQVSDPQPAEARAERKAEFR